MAIEEDDEQKAGAPAWVVTFGDMMSLLLTFFILLLSFSEIDKVRFAQIMGSLKDAFGVQQIQLLVNPVNDQEQQLVPQKGNASGTQLLDRLNSILPGAFAGGEAAGDGDTRVTYRVPDHLLFASGDSALKPAFFEALKKLAQVMKEEENYRLQIFGHTDDRPINTARFRNNWELSASRAVSVVSFLIEQGVDPDRLVPVGYADRRPLGPNDTPENRQKNRRVEFLFIETDPDAETDDVEIEESWQSPEDE